MKHLVVAVALLLSPPMAGAAEVTVFTPGAVQTVVREIAKQFEQKTGHSVQFVSDTAGAIAKRVAAGERGDLVISTSAGVSGLAKSGLVTQASIRDLGSMGVGVAVRKGAPQPDIHDVESFKAAMLAARSIMFADPAKGGQSGIHVAKVLAQLGIDKQLQPKLQLRDRGPDGLKEVAAGTIEIGLGQISEILANKDVVLVGPLPGPIQDLVTFSAAIHTGATEGRAAEELIRMLVAPSAKERFKQAGFV
jgi:molybdate transport system substrate-binding protein